MATIEEVLYEVREGRQENRAAHLVTNGRLCELEQAQSSDHADLTNLKEQVKVLAVVDKLAAFVFAAASGIAAAVFGK